MAAGAGPTKGHIAVPVLSFRNILVATDFSEGAHLILPYAKLLAKGNDTHLYVTHVVPPEVVLLQPGMFGGETIALEHVVESENDEAPSSLRPMQIGVGDTWPILQQIITNQHIDLVLVGTDGGKGLKKLIMGSVAEVIARYAPCPVLTVGPRVQPAPGVTLANVIYATDLNSHNAYAELLAESVARSYGGSLALLHVVKDVAELPAALPVLELLASRTQAEPLLKAGDPADAIVETAKQRAADLIVLGVRRPEMMAGHRTHLAFQVVLRAHCPVLTVGTEFHFNK